MSQGQSPAGNTPRANNAPGRGRRSNGAEARLDWRSQQRTAVQFARGLNVKTRRQAHSAGRKVHLLGGRQQRRGAARSAVVPAHALHATIRALAAYTCGDCVVRCNVGCVVCCDAVVAVVVPRVTPVLVRHGISRAMMHVLARITLQQRCRGRVRQHNAEQEGNNGANSFHPSQHCPFPGIAQSRIAPRPPLTARADAPWIDRR